MHHWNLGCLIHLLACCYESLSGVSLVGKFRPRSAAFHGCSPLNFLTTISNPLMEVNPETFFSFWELIKVCSLSLYDWNLIWFSYDCSFIWSFFHLGFMYLSYYVLCRMNNGWMSKCIDFMWRICIGNHVQVKEIFFFQNFPCYSWFWC